MPEPLLDIRNYSLNYGAVEALRNVSFAVGVGEIVGVVGESGCGKSSLINSILRLLPFGAGVRGEIFFQGNDLCKLSDAQMRDLRGAKISAISQDPMRAHNPLFTIGAQMNDIQYRENRTRREKAQLSEDMLKQVEIPDAHMRLGQYPHEFSGGMLQRASIAMALMPRPSLLIADEPTTALDATLEVRIIETLRKLHSDYGCSVLFISHHLGVIAELCQKVAVMYAGEVVEFGNLHDVFFEPRHPYTRRLLECDPGHAEKVMRHLPTIPGEVPPLADLPPGCTFSPRCDSALPRCTKQRPPVFNVGTDDDTHSASCWQCENTPGSGA